MFERSTRPLGVVALLLAPTAVAVAAFFAWSPASERASRALPAFSADVLDALDVALERSADGRWEMRIEGGALHFRAEAPRSSQPAALRADCAALGALVRKHVPEPSPWKAEITRQGAVVSRCPEPRVAG